MNFRLGHRLGTDSGAASASPALLALLTVLLGGVFFFSDVDWGFSTHEDYVVDAEDLQSRVAAGSGARQVGFGLMGLIGLFLVMRTPHQPLRWGTVPLVLLGGYYLICCSSVLWSDDPQLSFKRAVVLTFCGLCALGTVRQLAAGEIQRVVLAIATLLVLVGFATELALGSFAPLQGEYRFAGTIHPNSQGSYCGVMVLAAFFGLQTAHRHRWLYLFLLAVACSFLLLSKSRNGLGGCLIALSIAWFIGMPRASRALVAVGTALGICALLIAALLCGVEVMSELDSAARLGRAGLDSGLEGFNGRIPLWSHLRSFVGERPLLGYGYHAFWTPARIEEVSWEQGWTVPTAHSVYLDVVLSVGFCGAMLFATAVLLALARSAHRCATRREPSDCFLLSLIVFGLVSAVFESTFAQPTSFDSFFAACAVLSSLCVKQAEVKAEGAVLSHRVRAAQAWT